MRAVPSTKLTEDELFARIVAGRTAGEDVRSEVGVLCARWQSAACFVVRRVQRAYGLHSPDDEVEHFQEAVARFVDKGLDQFRGLSERYAGKSASPKTFFLRIAKHAAIDRYR